MDLLPAIDILGGKVVRLAQGDYSRVTVYNEDPVAQALAFKAQGAAWLHVVDLDGAREGRPVNDGVISRIVMETGLNVEVGGGVRTLEALERYVSLGASRVVMGTVLVRSPETVREAVAAFGAHVTAGIDARDGMVAVEGWKDDPHIPAIELVVRLRDLGLQHLVYTDITRDGMQTGIDAEAYAAVARAGGIGVVASGGISSLDDLRHLACQTGTGSGRIEGAITGRAVYEGAFTVAQALAAIDAATME